VLAAAPREQHTCRLRHLRLRCEERESVAGAVDGGPRGSDHAAMIGTWRWSWRLAAPTLLLLASCAGEGEQKSGVPDADLRRARAEALAGDKQPQEGLAQLKPLIESPDASVDDLMLGVLIARRAQDQSQARALLDRARALAPKNPSVMYISAIQDMAD